MRYIVERSNFISDREYIESVFEIIKKNCGPFINDLMEVNIKNIDILNNTSDFYLDKVKNELKINGYLKKGILWRGINKINKRDIVYENDSHLISHNRVNKDRKSTNTNDIVHRLFDEEFHAHLGIKPRSNGVFATSNYNSAKIFYTDNGEPFMIFPIGEYKIVWSKYINDLYFEIEEEDWYNDLEFGESDDPLVMERVKGEISKLVKTYQMSDLKSALMSGNEISIICDDYYLASPHIDIIREFYKR